MDLSSGFDLPNAYGLRADDFDYDMDSYRVAMAFLGDVSVGVEEAKALADNGGDPHLMRSWEGSQRFRRVLGKVRAKGREEREYVARRMPPAVVYPAAPQQGRRFIPLKDMPINPGLFRP